ncbi:MAG: hypothetical protein JNJ49_10430 [Bdellovibrionaceae bacterium]|nr:hypothetical protein [Pseudobdellovibrionaceae bacterium]
MSSQSPSQSNESSIAQTGDATWLVKSGDRILGPFSAAEVTRRLHSKELVVIDEVIAPQARWRHIRDEPQFAGVVDEIRKGLMTVRDDTEVGTRTPIMVREDSDEKTPVSLIANVTRARFDTNGDGVATAKIQDAVIVSETQDRQRADKGKATGGFHSTLAYSPPTSAKTVTSSLGRISAAPTSKVALGLVALAALAIGIGSYLVKGTSGKRSANGRSDEIVRLRSAADAAWNQGEFVRSLKLYEQINREPHSDLETDLRQAILTLRIERQTLAAKRKLEELLPRLNNQDAKIRARIALAVAQLQSDNPIEARNELSAIVREPGAGPIAFFNLACAQAASGLRGEAVQTLKKLETHPTLELPSRLLRALLFLKDGSYRQAGLALDISNPSSVVAWRQEVFAIGAAADWFDGNKRRSITRLRQALDTDPMQTDMFFHDPLVFLEAIRWSQWLVYIDEFVDRAKSNPSRALLAIALIKSDQRQEAQTLISESLGSRVNEPDLQAVNAYLYMTQGRDDEARGALRFARNEKASTMSALAAIMEARLCERSGDRNCADTVWTSLLRREPPPHAAMISQARIELQVSREKGAPMLERLRALYPNSTAVNELASQFSDIK